MHLWVLWAIANTEIKHRTVFQREGHTLNPIRKIHPEEGDQGGGA